MSFGMIFSIILIIVFIAFAFYGIMKFLEFKKTVVVGQFYSDLSKDVNNAWIGTQYSKQVEYTLISEVQFVCLMDCEAEAGGIRLKYYGELEKNCGVQLGKAKNIFLYPTINDRTFTAHAMEHLDLKETLGENPYCFPVKNSKIKLMIKKGIGDTLVTLERV